MAAKPHTPCTAGRAGTRVAPIAGLLLAAAAAAAQTPPAQGAAPAAILERAFGASADTAMVTLRRGVVYTAEVTGPGTPAFRNPRNGEVSAFVVPGAAGSDTATRRFEVYPYLTGTHVVRLDGLPGGATARLRLSADVREMQRLAVRDYRAVRFGIAVAAGMHGGYAIARAQSGSAAGGRGTDWEAALVAEILDRVGVAVGVSEQSFRGTSFSAHWVFAEARVRAVSPSLFKDRRTDVAAALRYSETEGYGPDNVNP
ncbi:MAG TPA: hypothetical protein VEH62_11230, partial [Gemmatimonadales bacterium]|nr:hypothetical protein [Gemmatimonadales bacterium]